MEMQQSNELIIDKSAMQHYHARGFDVIEADATYVKVCNYIGEREQSLFLIQSLEEAFDADFIQFLGRTALLQWRKNG